jgi:hypothetical protein
MSNIYKINSTFPKKNPSTKNIIDLLYSIFSNNIINTYFFSYILISIYDNIYINNKKLSSIAKQNLSSTNIINEYIFFIEYIYWNILETSTNKENKNNLLLQKKVYNIETLSNIINNIIISTYKSINLKINTLDVNNITKKIIDKMSLKKILPFLEKNHLPPLSSKDAFKTHKITSKKSIDIESGNNIINYYLYRENDIISKLPINYFSTGFTMERNLEQQYINIKLNESLTTDNNNILKKRYTLKTNFNNAVFYLLSYYNTIGFLKDDGEIIFNIPNIKNTKINILYNKSLELAGTPFNVPIGKSYFGLFPDIEQHFGSLGSFYDVDPKSGVYSIQFQLSYIFINDSIVKVNNWLDTAYKNKKNLTFLLWLPLDISIAKNSSAETIDLKNSILINVYEDLVPKIEKSKYLNDTFYYKYGEKKNSSSASHIIYILSTKE